jgi:FkbM family methyltransferase
MKRSWIRNCLSRLFHASPLESTFRHHKDLAEIRHWSDGDDARLKFYSQFVCAGNIVFDIGANLGNRTRVFHRLGAIVVSVEPQPRLARALAGFYAGDESVKVVAAAVGSKIGKATMYLSTAHVLSSLSSEWIEKVTGSGRFTGMKWQRQATVPVTTLGVLICEHGQPAFIKIDVEGFEYEVIRGLQASVAALSFEFTPEMSSAAYYCIQHLEAIGMSEFNFVEGESHLLSSTSWLSGSQIRDLLGQLESSNRIFGDVYARRSAINAKTDIERTGTKLPHQ